MRQAQINEYKEQASHAIARHVLAVGSGSAMYMAMVASCIRDFEVRWHGALARAQARPSTIGWAMPHETVHFLMYRYDRPGD